MIINILYELAATSSRLDKEAILTREKNNELLKKVFVAALNPYVNYYQKKIPDFEQDVPYLSLEEALKELDVLSKRERTGNAAIQHLQFILANTFMEGEVIMRIIERDLKCGVDVKTVNKIWPGLIPTFDVMLSHKDISGIKYPAYAQLKADGARCHLYFDGSKAIAFSRSGKVFELHGALDEEAKKFMKPGETFDGELLFYENDKPMDRKTSNGLANKANKGTISVEETSKAKLMVWDTVDFSSTVSYTNRWNDISGRIRNSDKFVLVKSEIVNNVEEAQVFFQKMISDGEEGAILKNMNSVWQPKRTKDLGKLKSEEEADMMVVDWEEGTGKNIGKMGALVCETSDGKIRVNVGTGWSDEDRETITKENSIGKILTVMYNQRITKKDGGPDSLFLPRAVEFRFDKNVANSSDDVV